MYLVYNNTVFDEYKDDELAQTWKKLARFSHINLKAPNALYKVDRTGTLPHFLPMETNPLPTEWKYPSFEQICDNAAKKIIAMNVPQVVFWSGGVDSTLIVAALLKNGIDKEAFTVICTDRSIAEYQWFHHFLKDQGVRVKYILNQSMYHRNMIGGEENVCTGQLADFLFHIGRVSMYTPNVPFEEFVPHDLIEFLEPLMAKSPIDTKMLYNYIWWCRVTLQWQEMKYLPMTCMKVLPKHFTSFYDSDEWVAWSAEHYGTDFAETDPNKYKPDAKDYIFSVTGDPDYRHKIKVASMIADRNAISWKFITKDFERIGDGTWKIKW